MNNRISFLIAAGMLFSFSLFAANQTVTNNNDSRAGSLRQAIADVGDGETITFQLSSDNETITLLSELSITKSLTIDGSNATGSQTAVTIEVNTPGTSTYRVFKIDASGKTVNLMNMTIKGGDLWTGGSANENYYGGGIFIKKGDVNLTGLTITGSKAYRGGGISINNGSSLPEGDITINTCVISGNYAGEGGGIHSQDHNTLSITNSSIINNDVNWNGGGINVTNTGYTGTVNISGSSISNNDAISGHTGGFFYRNGQYLYLNNSTFYGNTSQSSSYGGGVVLENIIAFLDFVTICGNSTNNGKTGGLYVTASGKHIYVKNSLLANNVAGGSDNDYYYSSGTLHDNGYNIVEVQGGSSTGSGKTFTAATTITGEQANLFGTGQATQILADNGGPTQTLAIGAGSVAIGAGTWDASITSDQRGIGRHSSPTIGAYEGSYHPTWAGTTSSAWETASNWSPSVVPTNADNIIIPEISTKASNPVIGPTVTADCNDLTIQTGGSLTIQSTASGTGSLITNGTISNSGTVEMQRYITESAWHLISIPTTGITANTFLGDYLQTWDETTGLWSDITDPETVLNTKQGYALWGTPSKATTYTFTGTPLTGNQEKGFTYTEVANKSYDGANIMGNPYPSALDWNLVIAGQTGLNNAVYCYNSSTGNYVSYVDGVGDCRYIPAMQGFVVMATTSGTLMLNNNYRVHNDATYYKSTTEKDQFIQLGVSGDRFSDKAYMCFNSEATTGFDGQYDALKLFSSEEASPQLYSFAEESILSINQLPECEMIQLGFRCTTSGIFTITLNEIAGISEAILEDTKTGVFHNLQSGAYQFSWDSFMDDENRFILHFKAVGIGETQTTESNILIYAADGQIFINGADAGTVMVTDVMGRMILQQEISGDGTISVPDNLQTGVYLVTVQNGKEIKTEKVFFK